MTYQSGLHLLKFKEVFMKSFIDKIKLLSDISFHNIEGNKNPMQVYLHLRQMIIEAEEEKVIPVKHGTWIKENDGTYSCSECGAETKVPFKPITGKEIYCKECYAKRNA